MKCAVLIIVFFYGTVLASTQTEWLQFSEPEKTALRKLRSQVQGIKYDDWIKQDWNLINYLRAKDLNVDSALTAFKETIKWRRDNRIDSILNEKEFQMKPPYNTESTTKNGNPVMIWLPGRWDMRLVILAGNRDKLTRYVTQMFESTFDRIRQSQETGGNMTQWIHILDVHGYNLRQHACVNCFPMYFEWVAIAERYYPSIHQQFFFLNTPRIFYPLLALLKPLFSAQTQKGLQVRGADKNEWEADLKNLISNEELPRLFGGRKRNWF